MVQPGWNSAEVAMGIMLSCFVLEALATPARTGSTVQQ